MGKRPSSSSVSEATTPSAVSWRRQYSRRPQLGGLGTVTARKGVACRPAGDHRGVAAVARAVPDVVALGDDRAGQRFVCGVHEAGEMAERIERRGIAHPIAQKGEEGVDVFGLVVGPDGRIVGFAAGGVHVAALGRNDALGGPQLGIAELGVDHRVGGFEHEVRVDALPDERHPGGELGRHVGVQGLSAARVGLEHGVERKRVPRGKRKGAAARDVAPHNIAARDALGRVGRYDLREFWYGNRQRLRPDVTQHIALAHERQRARREDRTRHFNDGLGFHVPRRTDVHLAHAPEAPYLQRTVDGHLPDPFVLQGQAVDAQQRRDVRGHAVHQAGVGVVGQGAQQGEDERTFLAERPARVDAPAEHEGHPLAAHLDVVVVRDVAADLPYDAPPVGGDLPALSAYGNCGQHENASQ